MKAIPNIFALVILIFYSIGCSQVNVTPRRSFGPPTQSVDVYRGQMPDSGFVEIAEMTTPADSDAVERLTKKAKKIGADGIIILGPETSAFWNVPVVPPKGFMITREDMVLRAIAIEYLD